MAGHPAVAVRSASDKVAGIAELDIETSAEGPQSKSLWFKSSAASSERKLCGRRLGRAGAQPYLSTDDGPAT